MTQRLDPFTASPEGYAALIGVEKYIETCGLDQRLIALVETRVSQINGCAIAFTTCTPKKRGNLASQRRDCIAESLARVQPLFGA
jgi:alkylhydroperoxidase family enzyme